MRAQTFIFIFLLIFIIQASAQVTPGPKEKQPSWDTTNVPRETISKHYDSLINECNETIKKLQKFIQIIQQDIESQQKQMNELSDVMNKEVKATQTMSKSEIEKKIIVIKVQLESLNKALKIKLEQVEAQQKRIIELEKEKQQMIRQFAN
jgi:galactokinase